MARLFEKRWNFPNCLGGLDGKHVKIYPPANSGSLYYNFKGGFSVVLMALVEANLEFLYVDAGQCGRHADGGIWRNCALNQWMEQGVAHIPPPRELPGTDVQSPYVIVGNGGFPLTEPLQRQYCRRNMEEREMIVNYRLSRVRHVSENAFGVMSNRFRCLLGNMQLDPDVATDVVLACCVLHNFLRRRCGKATSQTCWRPTRPRPQQLRATSSRSTRRWAKTTQRGQAKAGGLLYGVGGHIVATQNLVNL